MRHRGVLYLGRGLQYPASLSIEKYRSKTTGDTLYRWKLVAHDDHARTVVRYSLKSRMLHEQPQGCIDEAFLFGYRKDEP